MVGDHQRVALSVMKTFALSRRRVLGVALSSLVATAALLAQTPAPGLPAGAQAGGGGQGGRGGAPDPNPLSVVQQLALSREMTIPSALTAAQTAAASALVQASLTLPVNTAEIDGEGQGARRR